MTKKDSLLSADGKLSSMRWTTMRIVHLVSISVIMMLGILAYQAYTEQPLDWTGAALFLGGLASILIAVVAPKVYQKKYELNTEEK